MLSDSTIYASVKSAKDVGTGLEREMYLPIYVYVSKSIPEYLYPLTYQKDFPYNAQETVINRGAFRCKDDLNDFEPTCGWQYDQEGEKIWHSQGFCCKCDAQDIL